MTRHWYKTITRPFKVARKPTTHRLKMRLFPGLSSLNATETLPVSAHWRRIFIMPSAAGWFFGFSLVLMLIASLNFNNNMGLMLTFWMMGLAQVLLLATFLNLRGVRVARLQAKAVHAGETANVHLSLEAPNPRPGIFVGWRQRRVEKNALDQTLAHFSAVATVLPAGTTVTLPLPCPQRGAIPVPQLTIWTRHPAGMFTAWIYLRPRQHLLVYPQPEKNAPPWTGPNDTGHTTWRRGAGEEFDSVRPYQAGDPVRLIAWKRSAQQQELVSREYHGHHRGNVVFQWTRVSHLPVEQALSRLTAWIIRAEEAGLNYSLNLPGFTSNPAQGHAHLHQCLRALALYGEKPGETVLSESLSKPSL